MHIWYLILAHFISDFVLQPERIIKMKHESWRGNAVHSLIHGLVFILFLLPFLPNTSVFFVILILAVSHFFIDGAKINFEKRSKTYIKPFLIDQFAHILLILAGGYLLWDEPLSVWFTSLIWPVDWYLNPFVPIGFILLILVTYGYELLLYQIGKKKDTSRFLPNYPRMLRNLLLWGLIYGLILIFGVYSVAVTGLNS